jgi:hypothetical protein
MTNPIALWPQTKKKAIEILDRENVGPTSPPSSPGGSHLPVVDRFAKCPCGHRDVLGCLLRDELTAATQGMGLGLALAHPLSHRVGKQRPLSVNDAGERREQLRDPL